MRIGVPAGERVRAKDGIARGLATAAVLLAPIGPVAVPRGEERHPALGVALTVPPRYEPVPVQPKEPWIVLRYVEEKKRDAKKGATAAHLYLLRLEWREDPDPPVDPPPVTTFRRFVEQRLKGWKVASESAGREREGWQCREYELAVDLGELAQLMESKPKRWAAELRSDQRTWVLLGSCAEAEAERNIAAWRRCAESLEFFEPVVPAASARWTKFYAKNPRFREPELRVRARAGLIEGWEAEDTENYLIVYGTRNENLVQHLARRLESIRRAYVELFPAASEIRAVSTVRICKDQEEYRRYGGSSGTAGYWNPETEELVLYDFDSGQETKEEARFVLFHEAFHQYIHYAAGELAPHSWFNEGYGDYFSGAEFTIQGNLSRIRVNPWRIRTIQRAVESKLHPAWNEIAWMEKAEYYGLNKPVNYAMGWSMVYFLNHAKAVKKNPAWSKILPTYFETLKAANARERARLESAGLGEDEQEREKADRKVREEAASAAFRDVDMQAIEAAWREFTLELEEPK